MRKFEDFTKTASLAAVLLALVAAVTGCQHGSRTPCSHRESRTLENRFCSQKTASAILLKELTNATPGSSKGAFMELAVEALKFSEQLRQERAGEFLAQAYLVSVEAIAFNLANTHAAGFKRCRPPMPDMLEWRAQPSPEGSTSDAITAVSLLECPGPAQRPRVFTQGELLPTGERLDVAIEGEGFFEVMLPDGKRAFTRAGSFKLDKARRFVTLDGLAVMGGFQPMPAEITSFSIESNGECTCRGENEQTSFRVMLVRFANPEALKPIDNCLFQETSASGTAELCSAGENGCGALRQGFLEASNATAEEEILELMKVRRTCLAQLQRAKETAHARALR